VVLVFVVVFCPIRFIEAFVADKHGEMSQRAVVRTAALACILGRSSSPTGADAETIGQANSGGNKDKNNNNNNNNNNNSSKKESAVRRAPPRTSARKRVRITIPSDIDDEHDDMLTVTPEERISPTIPDVSHELTTPPHKAISLPSLADVLGHDRSSAALLSSTTASSFSKNFNADFLSLPSLHSLPAFRAQTATATVQVDVEIFKMPPALLAPQSTSETFSPAPKRRDSVAAVEETALLLVTLGGANKIALLHSH
jgi:hypothetical protein